MKVISENLDIGRPDKGNPQAAGSASSRHHQQRSAPVEDLAESHKIGCAAEISQGQRNQSRLLIGKSRATASDRCRPVGCTIIGLTFGTCDPIHQSTV
jgi:hypothetical protein